MLLNTFRAIAFSLCGASWALAAIYAELPPAGSGKLPTEAVEYEVLARPGDSIVSIDIGGVFSFDGFGNIPPNETRTIDMGAMLGNPGGSYRVTGLGWDVELDAYFPSWLSDASIAFGDDEDYTDASLIVAPGMGSDFGGLVQFDSNGIVDLTNVPGQGDVSFALSAGVLYMQFFEVYVDYGGGIPDAQWQVGSSLSLQVVPVPECCGMIAGMFALAAACGAARRRAARSC